MQEYLINTFWIPSYQREYSWETNELDDFWDDLDSVINEYANQKEHFLGQIVIHNDLHENKKYIIDGQQRTLTCLIFARALQVSYEQVYCADKTISVQRRKENDITTKFLGYCDQEGNSLHIHLNGADDKYFIDNIINSTPAPIDKKQNLTKSMLRMHKAYEFFVEKFEEILSPYNKPIDKKNVLDKYFEMFSEHVKIMYIETAELEEAFIIFETLNARGRGLETSDLLKNTIFKYQDKNIDDANKTWSSMIDKLDKEDCTKYIRSLWNSRHEFTREKELFKAISNTIKNTIDSKNFLNLLDNYSGIFHDIASPENAYYIENKDLLNDLTLLKMFKIKSFYPILLAMFQKNFNETDIYKVAHTLMINSFRCFTICKKNPNKNERDLTKTATEIYSGTLASTDSINKSILKNNVTDEEFVTQFKVWSTKNKDIIRYILQSINHELHKSIELNPNRHDVHIEHIMPVSFEKFWPETKEYHDDFLWRLGNLTLLSGKINKDISNKAFNVKKEEYKKSEIIITNRLASLEEWNDKTISKRQEELANIAVKIWKI